MPTGWIAHLWNVIPFTRALLLLLESSQIHKIGPPESKRLRALEASILLFHTEFCIYSNELCIKVPEKN
jgi:hypothetical protein